MEDFDDILFIPETVDVLEQVSNVLLKFFKLSLKLYSYDYLLLTDDQTFLALDRLVQKMDQHGSIGGDHTWRANFIRDQPVPRYGHDNPEKSWQGGVYPMKPSSTGSVISRDLIQYLSDNSQWLGSFGSIQASLSIWLSPLNPIYIEDPDWGIENRSACSNPNMVAYGPIYHAEDMVRRWNRYTRCGQICKCPKPAMNTNWNPELPTGIASGHICSAILNKLYKKRSAKINKYEKEKIEKRSRCRKKWKVRFSETCLTMNIATCSVKVFLHCLIRTKYIS